MIRKLDRSLEEDYCMLEEDYCIGNYCMCEYGFLSCNKMY